MPGGADSATNVANDLSFTIVSPGQSKDFLVTDNGDGMLTIVVLVAGRSLAYGPDGNRLFVDAGTFRFELLVDHGGTPSDPSDDEFLEVLGVVKGAGRADTADRDFCEDIHEFIG